MEAERAGFSDIEALTNLRIAYLLADHGALTQEQESAIRGSLPAYFQAHLNQNLFAFVLREEDRIVSCAFLLVIEKPMSPAFLNGKTGTVMNVYTCPDCRHRGYAKKVMQRLMDEAKALDLCTVELKATEDGYPLYHALGFADAPSRYHPMRWNPFKSS